MDPNYYMSYGGDMGQSLPYNSASEGQPSVKKVKRGPGRPKGSTKQKCEARKEAQRLAALGGYKYVDPSTANDANVYNVQPAQQLPPPMPTFTVKDLKSTNQWVRGCVERLQSNTTLFPSLNVHGFASSDFPRLTQQYQYAVVDLTNKRASCLSNTMCQDMRRERDVEMKQQMAADAAAAAASVHFDFNVSMDDIIGDLGINVMSPAPPAPAAPENVAEV